MDAHIWVPFLCIRRFLRNVHPRGVFFNFNLCCTFRMASVRGSSGYTCRGCGAVFRNFQQLGGHLSSSYLCGRNADNVNARNPPVTNAQQSDGTESSEEEGSSENEDEEASFGGDSDEDESPAAAPVPFLALHQLLQRPCKDLAKHTVKPTVIQPCASAVDRRLTYQMHEVSQQHTNAHIIYWCPYMGNHL